MFHLPTLLTCLNTPSPSPQLSLARSLQKHFIGSIWGLVSVGLFAQHDHLLENETGLFHGGGFHLLGVQVLAVVAITAWGIALALVFLVPLNNFVIPIRVSVEDEKRGLDVVEHNLISMTNRQDLLGLMEGGRESVQACYETPETILLSKDMAELIINKSRSNSEVGKSKGSFRPGGSSFRKDKAASRKGTAIAEGGAELDMSPRVSMQHILDAINGSGSTQHKPKIQRAVDKIVKEHRAERVMEDSSDDDDSMAGVGGGMALPGRATTGPMPGIDEGEEGAEASIAPVVATEVCITVDGADGTDGAGDANEESVASYPAKAARASTTSSSLIHGFHSALSTPRFSLTPLGDGSGRVRLSIASVLSTDDLDEPVTEDASGVLNVEALERANRVRSISQPPHVAMAAQPPRKSTSGTAVGASDAVGGGPEALMPAKVVQRLRRRRANTATATHSGAQEGVVPDILTTVAEYIGRNGRRHSAASVDNGTLAQQLAAQTSLGSDQGGCTQQ